MSTLDRHHARAAYDALARGYDRFTAGHDQKTWTGTVLELATMSGLSGRRLLDVACGTGSPIGPTVARGFEVVGVDISPQMLELARGKVPEDVTLLCHDMRELPVLGEFDLVWALCDAVNYLQDPEELVTTFEGFRRNLADGGVVAFDVDTLATMRALYSSLLVVPGENEVLVCEGRTSEDLPSGGTATSFIDHLQLVHTPWWRRTRSVHHQRHHPEASIRAALEAAGFSWTRVWGTDATGRWHEPFDDLEHTKAVYTARISAPEHEGR